MNVAFWNVNMGQTSRSDRKNAFGAWCAANHPDLLILEEASATLMTHGIEALSGMKVIGYVNTLDKNFENSTQCLCALAPIGNVGDFSARPLRLPTLSNARRGLIKVLHTPSKIVIWGIHANASQSGGREAVEAAATHLTALAGQDGVIGGDFNLDIYSAIDIAQDDEFDCQVIHPVDWNNAKLNFTQWAKQSGVMTTKQIVAANLDPTKPCYKVIFPTRFLTSRCSGRTGLAPSSPPFKIKTNGGIFYLNSIIVLCCSQSPDEMLQRPDLPALQSPQRTARRAAPASPLAKLWPRDRSCDCRQDIAEQRPRRGHRLTEG